MKVDGPSGRARLSERHQELLDLLETLFLGEGFSALTIGMLASRLQCSRRTLYELAPSKDALVLSVLSRFFRCIREVAAKGARPDMPPAERIHAYLRCGVDAAQRMSPELVRDIDAWVPSRELWQQHMRLRVDGLRGIVEDGVAAGAFRPVHAHLVAETVFAGISRLRDPDFYSDVDMNIADAFGEYYQLISNALRPPAAD